MRKPILTSFTPAVRLTEEFFNPKFGKAIVAVLFVPSWYVYPTTAVAISTSFDGSIYLMALRSAFFENFSNSPARPLCDAPCSKAVLQASLYEGPEFKHIATIKGDNVITKGYHYAAI